MSRRIDHVHNSLRIGLHVCRMLNDISHHVLDQSMEAEDCALNVRITSLGSPARLLITREDSMGYVNY